MALTNDDIAVMTGVIPSIEYQLIATAKRLLLDCLTDEAIDKDVRGELAKWIVNNIYAKD